MRSLSAHSLGCKYGQLLMGTVGLDLILWSPVISIIISLSLSCITLTCVLGFFHVREIGISLSRGGVVCGGHCPATDEWCVVAVIRWVPPATPSLSIDSILAHSQTPIPICSHFTLPTFVLYCNCMSILVAGNH